MTFTNQSKIYRQLFFGCLVTFLFVVAPNLLLAQSNASLPVAISVAVPGVSGQGGQIVVYETESGSYRLSNGLNEADVYGITVITPPLLFSTSPNTIPVITNGSVSVRFSNSADDIAIGDPLVSSPETGVAQKASEEDNHVFAIALEDSSSSNNGQILVHFDPVAARARHKENIAAAELAREQGIFGGDETSSGENEGVLQGFFDAYARGFIASIIAIGSLFFVMYTFRNTITNATTSVGRNPRARNAIMTVSISNIIFALIICLLSIFVALAILVLPV